MGSGTPKKSLAHRVEATKISQKGRTNLRRLKTRFWWQALRQKVLKKPLKPILPECRSAGIGQAVRSR
jgi:hypothetical protein